MGVLVEPRFVVRPITGIDINVASAHFGSGNSKGQIPTSYYVLDRWYAWRAVAAFSHVRGQRHANEWRHERAESRAAELNAWNEQLVGEVA